MNKIIQKIVEESGMLICPACEGEGEVDYWCGHDSTTACIMCAGKGVVRSLKKQKHIKVCHICKGRGGPGCCKNKGFHEWESYRLYVDRKVDPAAERSHHVYSTKPEVAALELIDGAYDIVELFKPQSPSQEVWRTSWLKKARELGAQPCW